MPLSAARAGGLACQAQVCGPLRLEISPESLSTPQRLQIEGQAVDFALDPPVVAVDVVLVPPSLTDLRSDATRVGDALTGAGMAGTAISLGDARACSTRLRAQQWQRTRRGAQRTGRKSSAGFHPTHRRSATRPRC